jgi:hypothetical protein
MAETDAELTVAQRLGQLLDRGLLPAGGPAEAAERLIDRLERPARVALLGLPGAGKSAILNLLTGVVVVPETLRLPTIIVQHGAEARMLCTLTDGRTEIVPGSDLNDVLPLNPALVTVEMDLPALKVISLLEVSAGPMEAEQRRAAIWASKRADIVIWCSTSYLPKEQQVWEGMPDVVKDNGFLFLTKVDLLGSREAADGMLERVEARAGEEFRQVLAISAKQARAAMPPGEPVNRDLFRDSGAAAVITTIKSRVQAARRADTDMAELLLARHVEAGGIVARRFAEPGEAEAAAPQPPPVWTPPPETPAETPAPAEVPVEPVPAPAPEPEEVPEPEPEPETVPDPLPELEAAPEEPEPAPVPEPATARFGGFARQPAPEQEPQPAEGRKRFSDRIKQMPVPDAAPTVPLRSTWKSKADVAAARAAPVEPEPAPAESPRPERRLEPRPRTALVKEPDPQEEDETLARMLASVTDPQPEPVEPEPEPVADEDEVIDEGIETEGELPVEEESPRWAERLRPVEADAPVERSPRTSLFGSRKPVAPTAQSPAQRPAERAARPVEPVARVRAPAPRPAEPPRPATPSPEELATPRILPTRERPQGLPDAAETPRRPRIARVVAATAPAPVEAAAPVPAAEQDLVGGAIRMIVDRSADLASAVDPEDKIPVDMILDHSRETVEQVISLLGTGKSSGLRRILADLGEIQDIIMLMQLEKGHAPADDALTLLLQIRRDLETLLAA